MWSAIWANESTLTASQLDVLEASWASMAPTPRSMEARLRSAAHLGQAAGREPAFPTRPAAPASVEDELLREATPLLRVAEQTIGGELGRRLPFRWRVVALPESRDGIRFFASNVLADAGMRVVDGRQVCGATLTTWR